MKIKQDADLTLDNVAYRLNAIGLDPYPIALDNNIKRATVTRDWISKTYGGNPRAAEPKINRKKFTHGLDDFLFITFDYNPGAPKNPGDPGLLFDASGRAWDLPNISRVIIRSKTPQWFYAGQYKFIASTSLTKEEWNLQSSAVCLFYCLDDLVAYFPS